MLLLRPDTFCFSVKEHISVAGVASSLKIAFADNIPLLYHMQIVCNPLFPSDVHHQALKLLNWFFIEADENED